MVNVNTLAEKIFSLLKGNKFPVKMFTVDGVETVDPTDARRFFVPEPGMMVTIDEEQEEVELNKSSIATLDETRTLQKHLKRLANEYLLNYKVREFNKEIQPRDFSYKAKIHRMREMGKVSEGLSRMTGSKKTSYQTLEDVKILVKHKQAVEEEKHGARTRNIHSIFLEQGGERFRFPHNHLGGARAMARHIQEGGTTYDKVGNYIIEKTESLLKLREFYRYIRTNKLINEESEDVVNTLRENIESIKQEFHKLTGTKTYESIKTRIEETEDLELNEDGVQDLKGMFTVKRFDQKYENVLPIVNKMVQERNQFLRRIEESSTKDIFVGNRSIVLDSVLEFSSDLARFGYKVTEIANRIQENSELSNYVLNIGNKLCKEQTISAFETSILENVLSNLKPQGEDEEDKEYIPESVQIEHFYNKYTYTFL